MRKQSLDRLPPLTNPDALALVAQLLGDPSRAVCEAAVNALARSGEPATGLAIAHLDAPEPAERNYAFAALVRLGACALPAVIALLDDPDADRRKYAVDILAQTGDQAAAQALIAALDDVDANVAAGAADALGALGAGEAMPALASALARQSDWLRIAALGALGDLGVPRVLAVLGRVSPDSPGPVLAAAAVAVGKLGAANPSRAVAILARLLSKRTEQPLLDAVVRALQGSLDGRTSWPPRAGRRWQRYCRFCTARARAAKPDVRAAAVYCLGVAGDLEASSCGAASARPLAGSVWRRCACWRSALLSRPTMRRRAGACSRTRRTPPCARPCCECSSVTMRSPRRPSSPSLCAEDGSRDEEDMPAVLRACGAEHLVPVVRYALTTSPSLRWAVRCSERCSQPRTHGKLSRARGGKDVLRIAAAHDDWQIRAHAVGLLGEAHARWARTIVLRACDDPEARVRVRAINALGQCAVLACARSDHVRAASGRCQRLGARSGRRSARQRGLAWMIRSCWRRWVTSSRRRLWPARARRSRYCAERQLRIHWSGAGGAGTDWRRQTMAGMTP